MRSSPGLQSLWIVVALLCCGCRSEEEPPVPGEARPQPVTGFQMSRPEWRGPRLPHIAIELPPDGCDLRLSFLSARQVLFNNAPYVEFHWTLTNVGRESTTLAGPTDNDADNVVVQAFLSQDTVFNPSRDLAAGGTALLAPPPVGMLEPGASRSGSFTARLPATIVQFPYLVVKVDYSNRVAESNEDNNCAAVGVAW